MSDPAFFGYGSLVNVSTHSYVTLRPARLQGWQRVWRSTTLRDAAFLSVERTPVSAIDGLLARVPNADWSALDAREAGYHRNDVSDHFNDEITASVYEVSPDNILEAEPTQPILLSYLDVVVQGYLQVFGPAGVDDFFATTTGWHRPILDDRNAPQYPRHQILTDEERSLTDQHLAAMMK